MIVYYRCLIEGKGVTPSIAVEMKPEQLLAGKDLQMQRALDVVRAM
jgi:C-terminal processing protease CtpA/Prc